MKQWDDIIYNKKGEYELERTRLVGITLDTENWESFRLFLHKTTLLPIDYQGVINFMGVKVKQVDNSKISPSSTCYETTSARFF